MTTHNTSSVWTPGRIVAGVALLVVWFAAACLIGVEGWFANNDQTLFAPIAATATLPVLVFLAAYGLSSRFRSFVLAQDIQTLTALQHWRVIGFAFLPLYFFGVLPGLFAWPAGLGDVAVGVAAAYIVTRMRRDPDFATTRQFVNFHLFGLLDFAVAVATAGLAAGTFPGLIAHGVTSAPMDVWPLNLFPSFGVPIFIILHLSVLLKVRQLRTEARLPAAVAAEAA